MAENKKPHEKPKGYPAYDRDDDENGMGSVASASDCTGLIQTPPASEGEAESYAELYNIPQPTDPVQNGLQSERKTKNNRQTGHPSSDT